ncbi:hypothetical protein HDN1F_02200 [gamma proteobacterium HdN1]|nr:hypothetical protein HDN1F_02200 [gamma proteobacterium HdN1]
MSTTQYFIGFQASEQLTTQAKRLLELRGNVPPQTLLKPLEQVVEPFIPEVLTNMLANSVEAVGLSPMASKVVNGAVDTLNSAARLLVSKLLKKRSDDEIVNMSGFIDDIYLPANRTSNGLDCCGAEISQKDFEEMKFIISEIRAGRAQSVVPRLNAIMIDVADLVLESFMKRPLSVLDLNFVIRKVVDGTFATSRAATHMVVNRVYKQLNDEELLRFADYFDKQLFSATARI